MPPLGNARLFRMECVTRGAVEDRWSVAVRRAAYGDISSTTARSTNSGASSKISAIVALAA